MFACESSIDPVSPFVLQAGSVLHHIAVPGAGADHVNHRVVGEAVIAHIRVDIGRLGVNPGRPSEVNLKRGRHGIWFCKVKTLHHQLRSAGLELSTKH